MEHNQAQGANRPIAGSGSLFLEGVVLTLLQVAILGALGVTALTLLHFANGGA